MGIIAIIGDGVIADTCAEPVEVYSAISVFHLVVIDRQEIPQHAPLCGMTLFIPIFFKFSILSPSSPCSLS